MGDVAPLVRAAPPTIPTVTAVSVDPVQSGLVASLARPSGNITGVIHSVRSRDALRRAASPCCSELTINFVEQLCQQSRVCDLHICGDRLFLVDFGSERLLVVERRFEPCAGVAAIVERLPDTSNACP